MLGKYCLRGGGWLETPVPIFWNKIRKITYWLVLKFQNAVEPMGIQSKQFVWQTVRIPYNTARAITIM